MSISLPKSGSIHFIGIGGYGMSPLASILKANGYSVSGSEQTESSPILDQLKSSGISIYHGHNQNIVPSVSTVVYSSAIRSDNPELEAAKKLGKTILHRSDVLNALLSEKKAVTISGTHGKTTSTALLAYTLKSMGLSPSFAIGGVLENINLSGEAGTGDLFVAESDESDGTFTKYSPHIALITNVDLDHLDHYKTKENIVDTFLTHLNKVQDGGVAILGTDSPLLREISKRYHRKFLRFGFEDNSEYKIFNPRITNELNYFCLKTAKGEYEFALPTIGSHDFLNCAGVLSVMDYLGLNLEEAARALKTYPGVKRRSTIIYSTPFVKILDDYAHNPGKVSACLKSLKEKWPNCSVTAFYQPHRYSRLNTMYEEFLSSFNHSDKTIILPIYAAGEAPIKNINHHKFASDLANHAKLDVRSVDSFDEALTLAQEEVLSGNIFITIGAGDVYQLAYRLKEKFLENQPRAKESCSH